MLKWEVINFFVYDIYIWVYVEFFIFLEVDFFSVCYMVMCIVEQYNVSQVKEKFWFWVMEMGEKVIKCWIVVWVMFLANVWFVQYNICIDFMVVLQEMGIVIYFY